MSGSRDELLVMTLRKMVKSCQDMQTLLHHDKDSFSRNDLSSVESSNKKKADIVSYLNSLAGAMKEAQGLNQSQGFIESIEQQVSDATSPVHYELQSEIQNLKTEIASCYQHIATNSRIVFSNIKQLKTIIDRLVVIQPTECIYDNTGNTIKYEDKKTCYTK